MQSEVSHIHMMGTADRLNKKSQAKNVHMSNNLVYYQTKLSAFIHVSISREYASGTYF